MPGQESEEIETGLIGPMQILKHNDRAPGGTDCGEEFEHLAKQRRLAAGLWFTIIRKCPGYQGEIVVRREPRQQFAPGAIGRRDAQVEAMTSAHLYAPFSSLGGEDADKCALPDPGLAADQGQMSLAVRGGGQEHAESLLLSFSSDHAGERSRKWRRRGHGASRELGCARE